MVTVIPPFVLQPSERLHEFEPKRLIDALRQQLKRSGYHGPAIGRIDGTYEADRGEYQPHVHMVASGFDRTPFERLRALYPPTPTGSAGLFIKSVTDLPRAVSYCLEAYWIERTPFPGASGKRRTKMRRLAPDQELEWLEWQASHSTTSLLFLYGLRRRGDALDRPGIAPRPTGQSEGERVGCIR